MKSKPSTHEILTDEQVKEIVIDIDTKLYVLNEVVYDKLMEIHEQHTKLKKHFCPELFTDVEVTMGDLMGMMSEAYTKDLGEKLRNHSFPDSVGETQVMKRPELEGPCEKL